MGRRQKYTDKEIIAALKKKKGMVYHAAEVVGCEPDTIYNRAKVVAAVAAAIKNERGKVVDTAEMKLFDAIQDGAPWAVQLALRTIGKDRGYAEQAAGAGGQAAPEPLIIERGPKEISPPDHEPEPLDGAEDGGGA